MGYKNIVLIGIMGCGKTTIGTKVAKKLNMRFLDLDQYIEDRWGSIGSLFEKGEEYFRDIEAKAVSEVSYMKNLVIATGGGVVERAENITALKRNGLLFFIDRPLDDIFSDIETSQRPLLKNGKEKLADIFKRRYPVYLINCDVCIRNTKAPDNAVNEIIDYWKRHH
jgi:shikimate kinase